ncbi:MFS transporter [Undibacterium sp. SXout7W]|uniref:MFS transporter n=1 Tax=Undibacterium sp. SXout7W TaxID=3413049 RepID=UPI003BF0A075
MTSVSPLVLLRYAGFGFPLALVALPLYVYAPQFYAERFHMSLTTIGSALLIARLFDAFIDPVLGVQIDRRRFGWSYAGYIVAALPLLILGFVALFHPPDVVAAFPFWWFFLTLMLVYVGFSMASIAYQSWGAAFSYSPQIRVRLTACREACGLAGVISAALLVQFAGMFYLSLIFVVSLLLSAAVLIRYTVNIPAPVNLVQSHMTMRDLFAGQRFRSLFLVFVCNGTAAAIPATLFLFFTKDRLQLGALSGVLLMLYFVAAAMSMPIWTALAKRFGEIRTWLLAMCLSILCFIWVVALSAGDGQAFMVICVLSGMTLGADLALPPAILAGVIHQAGHSGQHEGLYFGAWNWASKMNLALAAGVSLPLLEWLGYVPGTTDAGGLRALAIGYALVPCGLKLIAALMLWRSRLHELFMSEKMASSR